jgi:hypothetical protein
LNTLQAEARKATSAIIDRMTGATDADSLNDATDALADLLSAIRSELDERAVSGSKDPRSQAETAAQLARRPGVDPGVAVSGDTGLGTDPDLQLGGRWRYICRTDGGRPEPCALTSPRFGCCYGR